MKGGKEIRYCKRCGKKFRPKVGNQIYCGSKTNKTGCSWEIAKDRMRKGSDKFYKENKKSLLEYQKKRQKKERKQNTLYAQRQREYKRQQGKTKRVKELAKKWRERNMIKILEWNRKRALEKKGIIGFHTNEEWEELKKKHNYCCVICGISEKKLEEKWEGTSFIKLTRDHIIPVKKGGTDFIKNIQPLCISCNARKHKKLLWGQNDKIVAVSGYFSPLHIGHIRYFEEAKELGTKLIVIVNNEKQVKIKGSFPFMNEKERLEIIQSLYMVDNVILAIDDDKSVSKTLELLRPHIFCNGGDRKLKNIPETEICERLGIKMKFNIGGKKVQSSSDLLNGVRF